MHEGIGVERMINPVVAAIIVGVCCILIVLYAVVRKEE